VIELPGGIVLSRDAFDVGVITDRSEAALAFWVKELGLPVERTIEPFRGVLQHKLTMAGAVLKLNCLTEGIDPTARLGAVRLLRLVKEGIDRAVHLHDPDGNLVELVPANSGLERFGVHLAVSDEDNARHFYGRILGLERIGERSFDVAGAELSVGWSPDARRGSPPAGRGFGYLTLQVMDVDSAHELVMGRGAIELQAPYDTVSAGGARVSFVADPDGNRIEISQRPDLVALARSAASILDPMSSDVRRSQ